MPSPVVKDLGASTVLIASLKYKILALSRRALRVYAKMGSRKRKRCVDSEEEGKKLSREQIADLTVMADEEDRKI